MTFHVLCGNFNIKLPTRNAFGGFADINANENPDSANPTNSRADRYTNRDTGPNSDPNSYTDPDRYTDANTNTDTDANTNTNTNALI